MKIVQINGVEISLKEKLPCSFYNHNYYRIESSDNYYNFYDNDVLYIECGDDDPFENIYIGKFTRNGIFCPAIMFTVESND